jgi:hypothetical protein
MLLFLLYRAFLTLSTCEECQFVLTSPFHGMHLGLALSSFRKTVCVVKQRQTIARALLLLHAVAKEAKEENKHSARM